MVASEHALSRPARGLAWVWSESSPVALAALACSALSLVLQAAGSTIILLLNGLTPVEDLIRGFKSNEMTGVALFGIALGVSGAVAGGLTYRRMATRVAREEAIAAIVVGIEAAVLGAVLAWFSEGNVDLFARNYLDFEIIRDDLGAFVSGAKNTLILAFVGETAGILLGLMLAVLAVSRRAVVRAPARAYINFFRGTPLVWQLIFIGVGLPIGLGLQIPTYRAAMIAFGLNTAAYAAEVFRAGIRSIERGQLEAARGLGMSYAQALRYAIIPQAVRRVIPPLMNEFVVLIKDTSLVIVLGLTLAERDLMNVGDQGTANTSNATYLLMTGLGYLIITLPLIRIVNGFEKRLRSGLVGVGA